MPDNELDLSTDVQDQEHAGGEKALVMLPDGQLAFIPFDVVTAQLDARIDELRGLVSGKLAYQSKTDMDAAGAPPNGELAVVWNDTTAANNGEYGHNGTAWVKSAYDVAKEVEKAKATSERAEQLAKDIQPKRGSIRFYQRNGWNDYDDDSGHIWQSKEGVPWFHQRGTTTLIRASIPWGVMCNNRQFQIMGSGNGSSGNTFVYQLFGTDFNNSSYDGQLEFKMNIGSGGGYTLKLDPMPNNPNDILIVHSTDIDGNVVVSVLNAATGEIETEKTTTTTTTTGCPFRDDGFSIGANLGPETDALGQGAPGSKWCGCIAEVVVVDDVISTTGAAALVGGIYENLNDTSVVTFARDYSRLEYLAAFAQNDISSDSVLKGVAYPGSSVGMQSGLYVDKKPSGYIAGIAPGSTSAPIEFEIKTDGIIEGELLARVVSEGVAVTDYKSIGSIETGISEYTLTVDIPVMPKWLGVEFKCGDAEYIASDPIASGLKISITGQSQIALLRAYDEVAGVNHGAKYPASYCYHNRDDGGYPGASLFIVDHNPLSDGVAGFIHHCNSKSSLPICYISNDEPGTGVDQLCNDSNDARKWTWTEQLANLAGGDVSAHIFNWGTNNLGTTNQYGNQILTPLVEGIPTDDGGSAGAGVPVIDHYLYDGDTFSRNARFVLSPLTGHRVTTAGPLDADDSYSGQAGAVRQSQINWATERGITIGPFVNDLPTGGPHQYTETPKGNWRLGVRLAEAALREMGLSHCKNPEIESFKWVGESRNQIDVRVKMANRGALQTDGGDPKWGFEFDDGSGRTRLGFTAQIINPLTVRLTKDAGDWPDSVVWYYQFGGPLGYGTSISEYETCAGQLYDGVGMDGTVPGDSLGTPVASSQNSYVVIE